MISAKSLFNKAVYKNTLHRFKWGSFLYFIILFFSGPFLFLMRSPDEMKKNYVYGVNYINSLLYDGSFRIVPFLFAAAVPTVVALLVYNGVHSPRHSVFLHSLPTDRKSNYFSCLCGAFTLMFLPVAANAVLYIVLTLSGYGRLIGIVPALNWFVANLFVLFVMFSVASFSAFLTGNGFAMVAINALVHTVTLILSLAIVTAGDNFIYGFAGNYSFAETLVRKTPIVWIFRTFIYDHSPFDSAAAWIYLAFAVIIYFLAYLLYKKRKMEYCGDVAAFRVFKPILKYSVTAFAAIASGAIIAGNHSIGIGFKIFVVAVVCAIVYFAAEMLITKSLRVFKSYKGFAAFAVCFGAVVSFFAFTSVFGYETYIPSPGEVKEVSLYDMYNYKEPFVSDEAAIKNVIHIHENAISDIPMYNPDTAEGSNISLVYKLKNGKTLKRKYSISENEADKAMNMMFESADYKVQYIGLKYLNIDNIKNTNLILSTAGTTRSGYAWALNENTKPLFEAIKKDISVLSYEKCYEYTPVSFYIDISMSKEENNKQKVFSRELTEGYYNFNVTINGNFKNTLEFLKEKGYDALAKNNIAGKNMYILDKPVKYTDDYSVFSDGIKVLISPQDASRLYDEYGFVPDKTDVQTTDYYFIYGDAPGQDGLYDYFVRIPAQQLPDYLSKYVK